MEKYEVEAQKSAFERAKAAYGSGAYDDATLEFLFPQLAESEDEKIRKDIINFLKSQIIDGYAEEWFVWLEKQKETAEKEYVFRPLAGTDIDTAAEQAIKKVQNGENIVLAFNGVYIPIKKNHSIDNIITEYYLGIKEKTKAEKTLGELSEDDKRRFKNLCDIINDAKGWNDVSKKSFISWIKSLFQPHWKPTDEQLKELKSIASGKSVFSKDFIKSLYEDLKKL